MIDKRKSETPGGADTLTLRIVKSRVELDGVNATRMHTHNFLKDNGMRLEEDIYDAVSRSTPIVSIDNNNNIRGANAPKINPRR